jgi:hypothetical protein
VSNFLAVATVTAALQQLLQAAAGADVVGAKVNTGRPETTPSSTPPRVNIYLYQVAPNPALRNDDLPTRSSAGQAVQRPRAALDLHYLLTFYGSEDELEPQRLLGSVVRTLHSAPIVTAELIQAVITAATATPPMHPSLANTDLADQIDRVKFVPLSLNLEELSKLWSSFFQTPYALSVAYQASVVLIEQVIPVAPALPVLERDISVLPFRQPFIETVVSQGGADLPILATSTIDILGGDLMGDVTVVRIAGSDQSPSSASPARIVLPLSFVSLLTLRAGPQTVQVVQHPLLGSPPVPHSGLASNVAAFTLHPVVSSVTATAGGAPWTVTVHVDVTVGPTQEVVLALLDPATGQRIHVFAAATRSADSTTLAFPVTGVPAGDHIVQVFIDGADSPLQRDAGGNLLGPKVTLA